MKIILKDHFAKSFAAEVKAAHPGLSKYITEKLDRYGEASLTLDTVKFGDEENQTGLQADVLEEMLYQHAKATKNQSVMMYIGSIRLALKDLDGAKPGSLAALEAALIAFFKKDAIDGWVYKKYDEKMLAFVVNEVFFKQYTPREKENGNKDYVRLSFLANSTTNTAGRYERSSRSRDGNEFDGVQWEWGDFNKKTVSQLLAEAGLFHETADLKVEYTRQLGMYDAYRPRFGEQFVSEPGDVEYEYDPADHYGRTASRLLTEPSKYVNDDKNAKRSEMKEERDNTWWKLEGGLPEDSELFTKIPVHPYLRMFNLGTHRYSFKHVDTVKPYVFDKTLGDKIALPETHRDLIEILTQDLDTVKGDVIAGKSGGINILCQGLPGTGKTLTAEIFSEVRKKPLYRVHSGQLGTDPESVEKNLKVILGRAEQWKCILLIDEADVYIRRRGDDLDHNAIVACFLRTLEYFGGVLFMTTNRKNDVDDAITSRCIAVITYEVPDPEALRRIFEIQSELLGSELSTVDIDLLVKNYAGKFTGRDVKEMLKLATRYAKARGQKTDSETVRKLAQFKGF